MSTKTRFSLATLFAALGLLACACSEVSYAAAPTTPPPSPTAEPIPTEAFVPTIPPPAETEELRLTADELVGIWFDGNYIEFKSNGTYAFYPSLDALNAGEKFDEGKYGVEGVQFWFDPMSRNCNGIGFYQLTGKSENELEFTKIREVCSRYLGKIERIAP